MFASTDRFEYNKFSIIWFSYNLHNCLLQHISSAFHWFTLIPSLHLFSTQRYCISVDFISFKHSYFVSILIFFRFGFELWRYFWLDFDWWSKSLNVKLGFSLISSEIINLSTIPCRILKFVYASEFRQDFFYEKCIYRDFVVF